MRIIRRTTRFRKDFKRMLKRGADERAFMRIVTLLANDEPLPESCRPHMLSGNWHGYRECHIAPDWLLLYELPDGELILVRTGTHADLFR